MNTDPRFCIVGVDPEFVSNYSPDQPRDEKGRWVEADLGYGVQYSGPKEYIKPFRVMVGRARKMNPAMRLSRIKVYRGAASYGRDVAGGYSRKRQHIGLYEGTFAKDWNFVGGREDAKQKFFPTSGRKRVEQAVEYASHELGHAVKGHRATFPFEVPKLEDEAWRVGKKLSRGLIREQSG